MADGLFLRNEVQSVENLGVVTRDVPPGSPPQQAAVIAKMWVFRLCPGSRRSGQGQQPQGDSDPVKRPGQAPEFAVDSRGYRSRAYATSISKSLLPTRKAGAVR